MENNILIKCEPIPFLYKQIFLLKVNIAIKECNLICEKLKAKGLLGRSDEKISLLIPSFSSLEIVRKYFMFKGYNSDGSLKPLKKYSFNSELLEEDDSKLIIDIAVVDIYERNVYLYNYHKDDKFIEGYMIKDENKGKMRTLIFSKEKVKILIKNTNNLDTLNDVEDFVDRFIM